MPEVIINVGGRQFEVACQPGEEAYLQSAAKMLDAEAQVLSDNVGRIPENRMLLMAGLMLEAEGYVLLNGEMWKQSVVLEHKTDRTFLRGDVFRLGADRLLADVDTAGVEGFEAGNESKQRRLAAARIPEQGVDPAGVEIEINPLDHEIFLAIAELNTPDAYRGRAAVSVAV